jgi:hypothetical protein
MEVGLLERWKVMLILNNIRLVSKDLNTRFIGAHGSLHLQINQIGLFRGFKLDANRNLF